MNHDDTNSNGNLEEERENSQIDDHFKGNESTNQGRPISEKILPTRYADYVF